MKIIINEKDNVPIYQQIKNGIIEKIATGFLKEGEQAPSVREISTNSHVNPNTVARAYQELINEKFLFVKRGIGNFVKIGAQKLSREYLIKNIESKIKSELKKLKNLGFTDDEIEKFINNIRSGK